ncbi:MAG: FecR family protein [Acidobacteriales bacterium]|nr:FecR family protein [Terriglobales bacterium]
MMRRLCLSSVLGVLLVAAMAGVCAAEVPWAGTPGAARVVVVTGQVSALRDSVPWALNVGTWVQPQQMIISGADGFAVLEVSDGSTFEVYPNSRVTFRSTPGNWKDLIDLWLGRIKVHIQKPGGLPNHNRVHTPTAVISVRGTTFHVSLEDEDDTTLVLVEEGQVAVQHRLLPRGDPRLVNAGEYLRVYKNEPLTTKLIDKGSAIKYAFRSLRDALYTLVYRTPRTGGGIPGTGTPGGSAPLPGDVDTGTPPPPPPADPPPPPQD